MSRGPGATQIRIMQMLALCERLGESLQWELPSTGPYGLEYSDDDREQFRSGRRVPVWMLARDLDLSKPALSRALRGLENMEHVIRLNRWLEFMGEKHADPYAKYVSITRAGNDWLSVNNCTVQKLTVTGMSSNRRG